MIGSRLSVREEIAEDWDDADLDKITIYDEMKIVEQRLLKATEDFLEARKVDTSIFRRRVFSIINTGVLNMGKLEMNQSAVGPGATVNINTAQTPRQGRRSAGVGVITIIAEEAAAVRVSLGLEPVEVGGRGVDVGIVHVHGKQVTVAATRTLAQGQESAMAAYNHLREHFHPAVIALTGIAGGIHRDVRLGDVVVATRVICYDLRKETPSGTRYRGQEQQSPAIIGHAVKEFFTGHGDPAEFDVGGSGKAKGIIRVLTGLSAQATPSSPTAIPISSDTWHDSTTRSSRSTWRRRA
jgi:nucleoside phosphorylase